MTAETTRPPAVEPVEPQSPSVGGTGSRTGGLKAQGSAQAGERSRLRKFDGHYGLTDAEWAIAVILHRGCWCESEEPGYGGCGPQSRGDDAREAAAALRPAHYREAAASLRAIADHMPDTSSARDLRPGIHYAATLIGHTADDLTEGASE